MRRSGCMTGNPFRRERSEARAVEVTGKCSQRVSEAHGGEHGQTVFCRISVKQTRAERADCSARTLNLWVLGSSPSAFTYCMPRNRQGFRGFYFFEVSRQICRFRIRKITKSWRIVRVGAVLLNSPASNDCMVWATCTAVAGLLLNSRPFACPRRRGNAHPAKRRNGQRCRYDPGAIRGRLVFCLVPTPTLCLFLCLDSARTYHIGA